MPRYRKDINSIYISQRMQDCLRKIKDYRLTTIVAPMGYGKTTAALWYLNERQKRGSRVFRINIYSSDLDLFWQSFRGVFAHTEHARLLEEMRFPGGKAALTAFLQILEAFLEGLREHVYIFIDDCHLMEDPRMLELALAMCELPDDRLHILLASRNLLLRSGEEHHLGNRLNRITAEELKLSPPELAAYCRRCGIDLSEEEFAELYRRSEGWFSYVYLNLRNVADNGALLHGSDDIYTMMGQSLFCHHDPETRDFLTAMCLADEFTAAQAAFLTERQWDNDSLRALLRDNAFVRYLADTDTFRLHHLLREYMEKQFGRLPQERQQLLRSRYGLWHESQREYIHALRFFESAGDLRSVLRVIGLDRGVLLAREAPEKIIALVDRCTRQQLMAEPQALLVLMRRLFSWQQIPKMLELKQVLLEAARQPELTARERDNLVGECDLIMSFLGYNDIAAMSRLHQSAGRLMTRQSISIQRDGSFTFGFPSVLMMFHRESGKLDGEIAEMNRSMPIYYRLADGQGMGAEQIMEAEARFLRGSFLDARILLEKARVAAAAGNQRYILLCCDFLELRMALWGKVPYEARWHERKQEEFKFSQDPILHRVPDACAAYIQALLGRPDQIPGWIGEGRLEEANLPRPARPVYEVIRSQTLLAQKQYAQVIGREEFLLKLCRGIPYLLCELHAHIQLAAAWYALGDQKRAEEVLTTALELALPDGILMPFAENAQYLREPLCALHGKYPEAVEAILSFAGEMEAARQTILGADTPGLTDSELSVARLSALGKTRREIAQELYLSENTVRNYLSKVYDKLGITGSPKQKQHLLAQRLAQQK